MVRPVGRPEPLPDERALVERAMQGDVRAFEQTLASLAEVPT